MTSTSSSSVINSKDCSRLIILRSQLQRLVGAGGPGIGHVLFLTHIHRDILGLWRRSHDHPLIDRNAGTYEQSAPVLGGKQAIACGFPRFVSDQRALLPL